MAYADLLTDVLAWLDSPEAEAFIPGFIRLAEARINRDLRHWRMEKRSTATLDERFEDLPTDWAETIRIAVEAGPEIEAVSTVKMMRLNRNDEAGEPRYFTHSGGQFEFFPMPTSTVVELVYYAKVPALTSVATTNWLHDVAYDVYLYGTLMHSAPFIKDDARAQTWAGLYDAAIGSLNAESMGARHSGPLRMRVP